MPPKKGKKGKEGGGKNDENANRQDAEAAEKLLALQKEAKRIREDYEDEEKLYNQFLQEREKINYFWTCAKKTRNEREAELRNKERDLEDLNERQQIELKMFQQRLKHLRFHLLDQTIEQRIAIERDTQKKAEEQQLPREQEAFKAVRQTHVESKEKQTTAEAYVRALKLKQDERVLHLRQDYDRKARDLMQKYALRMRDIRDDCENKRKAELQRVEASKNREVKDLMQKNMKEFREIKAYYGDITSSNLELIKRLKEEHAELRKREMADAKLMRELKRKNAALSDPLKRAKSEVEELKETHARYLEDKRKIGVLKDEIAEQEKTLAAHSFKLAVLEQQLEAVSSERDTVVEQFQSMVYEVQQKSGMKNLLLEKKLENLEPCFLLPHDSHLPNPSADPNIVSLPESQESLEVADAQVSELMMSAGGGPAAAEGVSRKLDSVMANKNDAISGLQEERRRLQEAHAQLVRSFESKLAE